MELPVAQLLQQAIAAHQEGKLQDAERLYRSILQSQPDHAGVNHNLGLLAVSAGKINEALPLFENALRAKPNLDQFCLSYIDALIMAKQSDRAKQVLEKARLKGIAEQKLRALEHRLEAMAKTRNFSSERITEKQTPIKVANDNDPPRQKLVRLLEHYQEGRFRDAEELARRISQNSRAINLVGRYWAQCSKRQVDILKLSTQTRRQSLYLLKTLRRTTTWEHRSRH